MDSAHRNPRTALYISMGDLVDNGEQAYQWRTWLNSIRPLSANVPLATTLGNHEMYTLDWKMREPYAYLNYFEYHLMGMKPLIDVIIPMILAMYITLY